MRRKGWIKKVCHRWMIKRISRKLALDSVQQEKLEQLQQMMEGVGNTFHGIRRHSHEKLGDLLATDQFDRDKAEVLLDVQLGRVKDVGKDVIEQFGEFMDSLQPAQRQKLRDHFQCRCS